MSVFALLNKTCTIQRPTFGKDSVSGAPKVSSWTSYTGVRCAVQVKDAKEWPQQREAGETFYDVYFLPVPSATLTAIQVSDRITSATGYSNVEFEVTSLGVDDAGRGAYTRVTARTVTGKPTR